jgi:hypothetical protein
VEEEYSTGVSTGQAAYSVTDDHGGLMITSISHGQVLWKETKHQTDLAEVPFDGGNFPSSISWSVRNYLHHS